MINASRKGPRRQQRPYLKADITIEDQREEQKKLLDAARAFQGYRDGDLKLIAISYEHKCFSESNCKDEYIAKIRKKLIEWKYIPNLDLRVNQGTFADASPSLATTPFRENITLDKHRMSAKPGRSHHQRHQSGPLMPTQADLRHDFSIDAYTPASNPSTSCGGSLNGTTNFERTSAIELHSPQHSYSHLEGGHRARVTHRARPGSAGRLREHVDSQGMGVATMNQYSPLLKPQSALGRSAASPRSQPMSQSLTSMSDTSSTSSGQDGFVDIFNPKFLSGIDLNDPTIRAVWISSVWEYFRSGGQWHGYGHAIGDHSSGSQNSSYGPSQEPRNYQRDSNVKIERHASWLPPDDVDMGDTNDNPYPQHPSDNSERRISTDGTLSASLIYHQRSDHSKQGQVGQLLGTEAVWGDHPIALQLGMNSLDGVMVDELPADAWSKFGTLKPGSHH